MRLNKKYTINKYINMKCCWRSVAVRHSNDDIEDISNVNPEYIDFDISKSTFFLKWSLWSVIK